jgi:hypothetical protein
MVKRGTNIAFAVALLAIVSVGFPAPQESKKSQPVESSWLYDYGSPTSYQQFIAEHPYRRFHKQHVYSTPMERAISYLHTHRKPTETVRRFGVFVNATLYEEIRDSIAQYLSDLESSGWYVVFYTIEGGTPQEAKELIAQEYQQGMVGCVLVGDTPVAWFEDARGAGNGWQIDLYYADMDGAWADQDGNGLFDEHVAGSGDRAPEIWVMRLYATTLDGDEVALMKNYFRKNHAYREGTLTLPARALDYMDDDWANRRAAMHHLYDDVTVVCDNQVTAAEDYLTRLIEGYSLIRLWAHSGADFHGFEDTPNEAVAYAHCYVHSPVLQQALLRIGSDDGVMVWLNGTKVYAYDVCRAHQFDADTVNVLLEKGWNRLLVKVADRYGGFGFSARFSGHDGGDVENLKYQLNDPSTHGTVASFIRSWLVNGFHQDFTTNAWNYLATDYLGQQAGVEPDEGHVDGNHTWRRVDSRRAYVDLGSAYPHCTDPHEGVSYAFVRVYSPVRRRNVRLRIGSDDGVKVWVNGKVVHTNNVWRTWITDEDEAVVNLKRGWNRVLIKVSQWYGPHGFSARFSRSDGTEVEGLRYDPAPRPTRYIQQWLCNGCYGNPDDDNRLHEDYLGGEAVVMPSEGEISAGNVWQAYYCPEDYIDLNDDVFAKSGGEVTCEDLLAVDPACFFYDLWCCGSRACPNRNYLGGWYVLTDSYGLAAWGLLWPTDRFYRALGEGKCLGEAQLAYLNDVITDDSYACATHFAMYGDPTLVPAIRPASCTIYVDADAAGNNDGSCWQDAYRYLQDALTHANSKPKPVEIRIAQGTYTPDTSSSVPRGTGDQNSTFTLASGTTVKGGFAGVNAPYPNQRDVDTFKTILSGDLKGNDGPGYAKMSDNSYHVVSTPSTADAATTIDGVTITAGNADDAEPQDRGAGMFVCSSSPEIINCTFLLNSATGSRTAGGGGLCCCSASPRIENCTFAANRAGTGAGICNRQNSSPQIIQCTFTQNTSDYGGGIYNTDNSNPSIVSCTFTGNLSHRSGGAMRNANDSSPQIVGCIFTSNVAESFGGGAVANKSDSDPEFKNCVFVNNDTPNGRGGAVFSIDACNPVFTNCTLAYNDAFSAGAVCTSDSYSILTNCICWGHTGSGIAGATAITYSDIEGRWPGRGNIDADPLFADVSNGDYHLKSQAGRWDPTGEGWTQDRVTSPCIDAGNPDCALGDELSEPSNIRINMGAYGGTAEASKTPAN